MKNIYILFIVALIVSKSLYSSSLDEKVLANVGDEKITYERLESVFQKNMSGEKMRLYELKKDSLLNFLNLYIDYRLKVHDAIDRGFNKEQEVIDEIEQNKKLLTESFYYDTKVFQPNVNKIVDRRQYYFKFAYIMFPLSQAEGSKEEDNKSIKEKAQRILDSIKTNKLDYVEAARIYSADPQTAKNGGVVDKYLISGTVQRPIENQLFALGVNQVSPELLETSYGYFILRLVEKVPRKQFLISHILIKRNGNEDLTEEQHAKADSLKKLLDEGADFTELAELNSDDAASAINGGQLDEYYDLATGFVGTKGMLDTTFINAVLKLKDGEISDTVHTLYGIHIIKRIDSRSPDREKDLEDVKDIYKRLYYDDDKKAYYEEYVTTHGFELNKNVFSKFVGSLNNNETNLDSTWASEVSLEIHDEQLFSYNDYEMTVGAFIALLNDKSNAEYRAIPLTREGLRSAMYKKIKPLVVSQWSEELMTENKEFINLISEFHDGILLFKVEALEVWDKLQLDTAMAQEYFDNSDKKFMTNEKYDISEIFVLQDTLANSLYDRLKKGEDFAELATKFTQRQGYKEKAGNHGLLDAEDNKFSKILKDEKIYVGAILAPEINGRGFSILKINSIEKPREMTFEEAIPVIAPAVQQIKQKQLVTAWLEDVRERHEVSINKNTINEIYEEYHN